MSFQQPSRHSMDRMSVMLICLVATFCSLISVGCSTSQWKSPQFLKPFKTPLSPFAKAEPPVAQPVERAENSAANGIAANGTANGTANAIAAAMPARGGVQLASFESGSTWLTSMEQAQAISAETGKPILADFTGSDWCSYCVKLREEVFETSEFQQWAAGRFVLLELDYPKRGSQPAQLRQQNEELKQRYKISSYPTVLILDANGTVLGKSGYVRGGPSAWIGSVESAGLVRKSN